MSSEELALLLILGLGIYIPIIGIVVAIVRVTYKNERQFSEKDLNEDIKNYLNDEHRRSFLPKDKMYYKQKRKGRLSKWIVSDIVCIFFFVCLLIGGAKLQALYVATLFLIAKLCLLLGNWLKILRLPKTNSGCIIKGYILKYIKITTRKGVVTDAFIVYFDYIQMKYKTYEVEDNKIRFKGIDEKTGTEYVELICKEKKKKIKIYDVLS